MANKFFTLLLLFTPTNAVCGELIPKRFDGDKVLRLFSQSIEQQQFLKNLYFDNIDPENVDFWAPPSFIPDTKMEHPTEIRIAAKLVPSFIAQLEAIKLPYKVIIGDVQKVVDKSQEDNTETMELKIDLWRTAGKTVKKKRPLLKRFGSYEEIVSWLNLQCKKYPEILSCMTIGKSFEKRDLILLKISTGNKNSQGALKKGIFIEAGVHAREWLAPATALYLIDKLINKEPGSVARRMIEKYDWHFLPVANPDGYEYSRKADRMWRKTRSYANSSKINFSCYGVDANRNFDFHWSLHGSSKSICSDLFHGSSPFSEPETKSMANYVMENRQNLIAFFSLHAFSQYWLVPFGHKVEHPPNDLDELMRVAKIGTAAIIKASRKYNPKNRFDSKWIFGNSFSLLQYPVSGSSMDWAKGVANISYAYALELRPRYYPFGDDSNGFIAQTSDIDKSGDEVFQGLSAALDAMIDQSPQSSLLSNKSNNSTSPSPLSKLAYAFGSLAAWIMKLFSRQK